MSCSSKVAAAWKVVKLCRFNLVLPILVGFFMIVVPNGQEVLLRMESESASRKFWFFLILIVWALSVWYWARVILSFQFQDWPPSDERRLWILKWHLWMPRICGILALVVVLWAIALTSYDLKRELEPWKLLFLITLSVTILFWLFVWRRRRMARKIKGIFCDMSRQEVPLRPLSFKYEGDDTSVVFYTRFMELPRITKLLLLLSLGVLFVGMLWLFLDPDRTLVWAPRLGSATILLLAASGWTCIGALVMYWANHYRVPVFLLAFAWLTFLSAYNDDHEIRTISAEPFDRETLKDQLEHWLKKRAEVMGRQPGQAEPPVFIVAAEGGGIMGAYWTASVLARIEKAYPGFASHVFAISGVSGGSLGAAVFDALLAEEQEHRGRYCMMKKDLQLCAQDMLQHDFVAPNFAAMLYPDLVKRFLPPIFFSKKWDRGVALEMAWERAWDDIVDHTGKNPFRLTFEQLWDGERRWTLPGLVLNSTSVEKGKRVLLSNFRIEQEVPPCPKTVQEIQATQVLPFHDVLDLDETLKCFGPQEPVQTMRLSTAVHNSARFAFVSPAGTIAPGFHIVDGGYFENSGATAAVELVQAIEKKGKLPIVIYISNSPTCRQKKKTEGQGGISNSPTCPQKTEDQSGISSSMKFMGSAKTRYLFETLTPLWAIINARSGRGSFAVNWLQLYLEPETEESPKRFFTFGLEEGLVEFPLGWTLSKGTWEEMDRQLEEYFSSPECKPSDPAALPVKDFFLACWPDIHHAEVRADHPSMR
jgi:hypothetical protein